MINKKVFALTLVASSIIAAGCSSDDDDDDDTMGSEPPMDMTTDAVLTDAQSPDVDGDGVLTDADDVNGDGLIDQDDVTAFAGMNPDGGDPDEMGGPDEPTLATLPAGEDYDITTLDPQPTLTLAEVATAAGLNSLVEQAGNCEAINAALADTEARLTVFAPDDAAFAALTESGALNDLSQEDVCDVLAGHVLADTVADSSVLTDNVGTSATTLAGTSVDIAQDDDGVLTVGGSQVTAGDNFAINGVAHVINAVILPAADTEEPGTEEPGTEEPGTPTDPEAGPSLGAIGATGVSSEFQEIYAASGFGAALDDNAWTVFVPSDDAIDDGVASSVAADSDQAVAVVQDHVLTEGAFGPDELPGTATTNGGVALTIVSGDDGITVNGFNATQIESDGMSTIYQIDGLLQ